MDGSPSALYLYDIPPFGNPVGMGLTSGYSIMWLGHSPDFIPSPSQGLLTIVGATFVTAPGTAEVGDNYDNWIDVVYQVYIGGRGLEFSDGNSQNPVRCVKN
jgi:hypothetical protein